jgi:glyoxylase-like metal-dependent hydrolase (beta-lactamase superfamily II)
MRTIEVAEQVYWLPLGAGLRAANAYFIGSTGSWCLVDAGWPRDAPAIRQAADELFGAGARPAAVLLTHDHPDHAGAARELALAWGCRVWMHPIELPLASADAEAIRRYAGPLDKWVILPLLRLMGRRRMQAILAKGSLAEVAAPLDPGAPVPGLPEWEVFPTPGHTPGHVAYVRRDDRVVLTGDALVSVDLNSLRGIVSQERTLAEPPWYTTWSWPAAKASAAAVAGLAPRVVAAGHGAPLTGPDAGTMLRAFLGASRR